jgi:hypothetical protein
MDVRGGIFGNVHPADRNIPTFMAQAGEAVYTVPNLPGHPSAALRTFPTLQNPVCYSLITKAGVPHVSDHPTPAKGKRKAAGSPKGSGVKAKRIRAIFDPADPMECAFWAQARTRSFPLGASIG